MSSGTFQVFADAANELADRLDSTAMLKRTVNAVLDPRGAEEAETLAHELRTLADRFRMWPTMDPLLVSQEKAILTSRLLELQRRAEQLIATLPKRPP